MNQRTNSTHRTSRRSFVKQIAAAGAALPFAAPAIVSASANEKLNIAAIGVGGKGQRNLARIRRLAPSLQKQ